jgi:Lrp/AsnC family transcriptional regulator, leucine-responsive regulatory protein
MTVDLDKQDLQIVALLLRDGRTPAAQIAEQVGLSRPAVADRIEKLERLGVILGTTAVVDPAALGRRVTAFVAARGGTWRGDSKAKKAFEALMHGDEVVEAHTVAGDDCYFIKVRTDSIASLNAFVAKLGAPPLSLDTRTTIVMQTHCEKIGGITLGEKS